jgi:hypothetical protein
MKVLEDSTKRIFATGYIALLIGAVVLGFTAVPQDTRAASTPQGLVIPLYAYPTDGSWAALVQAKLAYPNVPFIAVINPNSGPGSSQDPNYVQGIKNLQASGIEVLGYADTAYGADSISSVEANVNLYHTWYGVNGIMFDDMSNTPGFESYYSTLGSYVHSLIPNSITMGNPGTSVPTSFIGTLDILNIYEASAYPPLSFITYPGYAPSNFAVVAFGVSLEDSFLTSITGTVSWIYITDAGLPNPYAVLPSYFTTEVALLSSIDGTIASSSTPSTSPTTTTTTGGSTSLVVNSVDLSGNTITGMWTTWNQNGAVLSTGYTPATFTGTIGQTYSVTVANYGSTVFCYWQDGSTIPNKIVTLARSVALTAYYGTDGSCSAATTTTTVSTKTSTASTTSSKTSTTVVTTSSRTSTTSTTAAPSTFLVKIQSATTGGLFSGMSTVVSQNGVTLSSGYTPLTFTATRGTSYTISVDNYGIYVFNHWSTGSTSPTITITPGQAFTLTAYYATISCPPTHRHC